MAAALFWISVLTLVYVYFGYPLLVCAYGRLRPRPVRREPVTPTVSILISAYNEEDAIGATLANKLELDYPRDRLEVIVVSDGSTDATDAIAQRFAQGDPGRVRLVRRTPRQGKTAALNHAAELATGEVLVFSDANSLFERDALRRLVRNFADPEVGYVTGQMRYGRAGDGAVGDGCSAYMRYENLLRRCETAAGSIVGVDGGIDAVRRSLYRPMRPDQLPDFVLPLAVAEQGYRVVYEPEAVLREDALASGRDEYRMRVRVALRALWALWDMRRLASLPRHGWYAFQLVSHKWLRYFAFVFMLIALAANAALWEAGAFYRAGMVVQALFYAAALGGWLLERTGRTLPLTYVPYYFTLVNAAAAHAAAKFVARKKQVLWTPRAG